MVISEVATHGGSFYSAAIDIPSVFSYYFLTHLNDAGQDVYPFAYGTEGAFLIMAAGRYGWWYDPDTDDVHVSSGTDSDKAMVFGLDPARLTMIHDAATAHGLTVVRCVNMATNEVT
jgi:hypothetical protein